MNANTQKHTHRHAHSEASVAPLEAEKNTQPARKKLHVVLYTAHCVCAAQVKHTHTDGVEAFPGFLS